MIEGEGAARLRVGLVGAGRAGAVLAAALQRAGHHVGTVNARSEVSLLRAQALLPDAALGSIQDVFASSDLVLLTVPDDSLAEVSMLAAGSDWVRPGQFVVHCSGRYGVDVLDAVRQAGALPLALHPVMTFTGTSLDLERLTGCPFGVTAPEPLVPAASALVIEMGGEPMSVDEDRRPLYHAALAHASNHLVSLVAESMDLLSAAGVADPGRMLQPLLSASLSNALAAGDQALTGPVARGDAGTVAAHLTTMAEISEHAANAYRAMARRTADRALVAGHLNTDQLAELMDVLSESGRD